MDFIAIITIFVLIVIGLFHFYWAYGGKIGSDKALPTKDGELLLNPSKALTFFVGIILIVFAHIAYGLQFYDFTINTNRSFYLYGGLFLSIIFTIRAIGEFNTVGFFKKIKDTEFAIYDTKYYSPLCLLLGLSFAILAYNV
ncbi:DUF3995 domain-containing protein [Sulfurimonas sp.]|uniref:DUF3995 domain-containing protein n=1 Tax=Sulfurimonas sp. TaxID=2022749 RepID=UPI003D11DF03